MTPPDARTPAPGFAAKASTTACACAIASADGVKTSLMIGTCDGWIAILPRKPSRQASSHSRREAVGVAEVDIDGVDRRDLSGSGAGEAQNAREAIGIEPSSACIAVAWRAKLGGEVFGAPGQRHQSRAGARESAGEEKAPPRFRWQAGEILIWPSGMPLIASRTASLRRCE